MKNNYKKKRVIFLSSIFAISILALFFVIINFRDNIVFFYSPSELRNVVNNSRTIRVGGLVKENTIKKIDSLNTEFVITDLDSDLKICYTGILPNLFRDRQGVVAKGLFNRKKNEFVSRELLIKHDENYMPPEVNKAINQ